MSRTRERYCVIRATTLQEILETCNRHITNIGKTQADYVAEGDGTPTDDFYCDMFRSTWQDLRDDVQAMLDMNPMSDEEFQKRADQVQAAISTYGLSVNQAITDQMLAQADKKPPVLTESVLYFIEGTEYERGWGQRSDGYVVFRDEASAKQWIKEYDEKYNNKDTVPDEYVKYTPIGFRKVSALGLDMMARSPGGHFHIDRLHEAGAR